MPTKPEKSQLEQLLANLERLVHGSPVTPSTTISSQLPPSTKWLAVCYDHELGLLDSTTLRQEPSRQANPAFIEQPLLFPWVYIPNHKPNRSIRRINSLLTFRLSTKLDVKHLADIVSAVGGYVFTEVADHSPPPPPCNLLRPTPRDKHLSIARHRSQSLRYTRQLRQGQRLADSINSHTNSNTTISSGNRSRYTAPQLPITPQPDQLHVPGHMKLAAEYQITGQEAEDELRQWLRIHTFAEEIVQALDLRG